MKILWLLYLGCLTTNAYVFDNNDIRIDGENGWYVPHFNGSWKWITEEEISERKAKLDVRSRNSFLLYTKSNLNSPQYLAASVQSIAKSNFNRAHRTIFVIHGWTQDRYTYLNKELRQAYFHVGEYNYIYVEWRRAHSDYLSSSLEAPNVGSKVAKFIDFLVTNFSISLNTICVVGNSLGSQVAGFVGKYVKSGTLHTIISLDAAKPLFLYNNFKQRLNSNDAFYVESIQTNGGQLGYKEPIGTATFYPNGGEIQPNCGSDTVGFCSHSRAVIYFAEALIRANYGSIQCRSYTNALSRNCGNYFSPLVRMGAATNRVNARGVYYVPIRSVAPYGILRN